MDKIDRHWIKERIAGRRGIQAELARAIGLDQQTMTKVMSGTRRVQADEVPAIIGFFKEVANAPEGFSDNEPSDFNAIKATRSARSLQGLLDAESDEDQSTSSEIKTELKIAIVGGYVQISATLDKGGLRELKEKITLIEQLMD